MHLTNDAASKNPEVDEADKTGDWAWLHELIISTRHQLFSFSWLAVTSLHLLPTTSVSVHYN